MRELAADLCRGSQWTRLANSGAPLLSLYLRGSTTNAGDKSSVAQEDNKCMQQEFWAVYRLKSGNSVERLCSYFYLQLPIREERYQRLSCWCQDGLSLTLPGGSLSIQALLLRLVERLASEAIG